MHLRSDGVPPPSSTRTVEKKRESVCNKACKVLINPASLLSILKTIYREADETISQMRPVQSLATMNAHRNPINTGTTHSTNQEREETPPRLGDVNLEDISIRFLCTYSTHPSWKRIVSSRNGYGQTIAHIAVTLGYFRLLQHLSTWQIDVNALDDMGSTALHYAYLFRQEECTRLLIQARADPFLLDDLGRTPSNLNPSLEVGLHPVLDIGGDSGTHSISTAECTIEMPKEAEARKIEKERRIEPREMPISIYRGQDGCGNPDAASTVPINHSVDEGLGRVMDCQSFSTTIQPPQGNPTLVAPQIRETLADTAVPVGVLLPPVGASAQAKRDSPGHTKPQGHRSLSRRRVSPSYDYAPPYEEAGHSGA